VKRIKREKAEKRMRKLKNRNKMCCANHALKIYFCLVYYEINSKT
jgi:hypothetical protein